MGGGTEADLTHGAVAAMSGPPPAEGPLRPVLQLADAPRLAGINPTERYGVLLSDGLHSQEAVLAASMNGLVRAGLLRRGSVVRVLDYVCSNSVENRRVIIVIQLEILQTECTLIGSPTIYDVNAVEPKMGPYSDSLGIHGHCMISRGKQGFSKIACSPDQSLLGSSKAARKDILQRLYGFVPTQNTRNTIDAKMHQLSLNSCQGQVRSAVEDFDWPGNTESMNNVCRTIAQIKDENFGMLCQPEPITVVAAISYVCTDAFCYPACTLVFNGKRCIRKVTANDDGWWCKRCLRSFETCEYRYMFMCQIQDHTGSTYATALHEAAEEIISRKAPELFVMKHFKEGYAEVEEILQGILWGEYRFQLRVKEGAGHGVKKFGIVKAEKLDPSDMSRHVLGEIGDLLKVDSSSAPGPAQGIVTPSTRRMSIDGTSSSQWLTTQTSNNTYGGGMTMRRQMPTPPQATPSVHAECFKCSRGARSPMILVGSPASEARSIQAECFRCSRGVRSPVIQ